MFKFQRGTVAIATFTGDGKNTLDFHPGDLEHGDDRHRDSHQAGLYVGSA
jgi:hypothetical protein